MAGFLNTPRRARTCEPLIKSLELQHFDDMESTSGQQVHTRDCRCQRMTKSLKNKGYCAFSAESKSVPKVQGSDCDGCSGGRSSDKQNDKQNDKRVSANSDLQQVIDAWSDLPEIVKAGMLAMVNALDVPK